MKIRKKPVLWLFKPASAYVFPQPLGVVGVMAPWNYPLYLALVPSVYALAAGNRVMIKISEQTPKTGETLVRLFDQEGIEDNLVTVINGDVEVAKKFANLPFNHLLFTGSTVVGREIMATAAKNLTPVTLELGGKSPAIISTSVNLNYFSRLLTGKFYNAGQTCIAPDYLLIPKGWGPRIEKFSKEFMEEHYPDFENNPDYSCLISVKHKERLEAFITDAREKMRKLSKLANLRVKIKKCHFISF
nr:aldehyde dehydrogenase family protein [Legionella tunisiensis]